MPSGGNPRSPLPWWMRTRVVSAEYTTYFRSVIAFGRAFVVEGCRREAGCLSGPSPPKYSADQPREKQGGGGGDVPKPSLIGVEIDHMTGKEAIEYAKASQTK